MKPRHPDRMIPVKAPSNEGGSGPITFLGRHFSVTVIRWAVSGLRTHVRLVEAGSGTTTRKRLEACFEGDVSERLRSDAACLAAFPVSSIPRIIEAIRRHGEESGRKAALASVREALGLNS